MFYLLENNRIIDSNMLFTKNIPLWEVKDNLLFAKSKNGKLIKPYKYNAIKNQSENVFELIEKGDLIKCCKYDFDGKTNEYDIHNVDAIDEEGVIIMSYTVAVRFKDIYAIFKPDDKGNYIKVWEREEENGK